MGVSVEFTVYGLPVPQGSKKAIPTARGPRLKDVNERELNSWRGAVAAAAAAAMRDAELLGGPLSLRVEFRLPRPKSHYRPNGTLKDSAPVFVMTRPDVDKLCRAVLDSLTGICFHDDSQIARLTATKMYGDPVQASVWLCVLP